MSRFFTCHWQNKYWNPDCNSEGKPIRSSGGNRYTSRGIAGGRGHKAYIVSMLDGQLYLGGRMTVSRIVSREEAVRIRGNDRLYPADEWLIDDTLEGGTSLHLRRRLAPKVAQQIRCILASGEERGLFFVSDTHLDVQATRGVRELTAESAEFLDRIITLTDAMPPDEKLVTVTDEMLLVAHQAGTPSASERGVAADRRSKPVVIDIYSDEVESGAIYREGAVVQRSVNAYERNSAAREACIAYHGTNCCVCDINFGQIYGPEVDGLIHVHHLRSLSEIGAEYTVDSLADLRPVCPNCHAVLHSRTPAYSIEEVRGFLRRQESTNQSLQQAGHANEVCLCFLCHCMSAGAGYDVRRSADARILKARRSYDHVAVGEREAAPEL